MLQTAASPTPPTATDAYRELSDAARSSLPILSCIALRTHIASALRSYRSSLANVDRLEFQLGASTLPSTRAYLEHAIADAQAAIDALECWR